MIILIKDISPVTGCFFFHALIIVTAQRLPISSLESLIRWQAIYRSDPNQVKQSDDDFLPLLIKIVILIKIVASPIEESARHNLWQRGLAFARPPTNQLIKYKIVILIKDISPVTSQAKR